MLSESRSYKDMSLVSIIWFNLIQMKIVFFYLQQIIRPLSNPIKKTGHIQILYGNLAPEGSVAKITGKEGLYFSGRCLYRYVISSSFAVLHSIAAVHAHQFFLKICSSGPALVFEGEESMLAAISENPMSFKVKMNK